MVALLGVLWAGLLKGVLIGAILSLVLLIRRVSSPHVAFLGRIPAMPFLPGRCRLCVPGLSAHTGRDLAFALPKSARRN
jgi:hypothetical protein